MTKKQAIEFLQTKSCVHCSYGAISPRDCLVLECELKSAINMAIKALEQQPSDDCVSRQAVDQNIYDYAESNGLSYANLKNAILDVPPVTPAQSWTPIEVREPTQEEKEEYLKANGEELCYMVDSRMPEDGQEVLVSHGGYVTTDVFLEEFWNFENLDVENVEAWMPLPQPYEEKRGNEDDSN